MRKIFEYFLIFSLLAGMVSCRVDKTIPCSPKEECCDFPNFLISFFSKDRFQYKRPYFNPNNENEFVYNYIDYQSNEFKLKKYNLLTGQVISLDFDVYLIGQPKWSRNGWITFDNVFDYEIWIVKDNGDSLKKVTNGMYNLNPVWDYSGNNLLWQYSPVLGIPYYLYIQNQNDFIIETIYNSHCFFNDISNNNQIISQVYFGNDCHIAYSDLPEISFISTVNLSLEYSIALNGLCWAPDGNSFFYSDQKNGLFQVDLKTGEKILLLRYCDSKSYAYISCSPDGNKLIGERIDSYYKSNAEGEPTGEVVNNSSIYLIDLMTQKETKVDLH